jgi:glyoxylate utilization-related uncharacterized protein
LVGFRALIVSFPARMDATPLLRGLLDDRCHCPHWGYILKGQMRVIYADQAETLKAGDLWYLPPGHTVIDDEDMEFIEFSPPKQYDKVLEVLRLNGAAQAK